MHKNITILQLNQFECIPKQSTNIEDIINASMEMQIFAGIEGKFQTFELEETMCKIDMQNCVSVRECLGW